MLKDDTRNTPFFAISAQIINCGSYVFEQRTIAYYTADMGKVSIKIVGKHYEFELDKQLSLLENLLKNNIPIEHSCGGNGSCGTCRVRVLHGLSQLPGRSEIESDLAEMYGYQSDERLSCQLEDLSSLDISLYVEE